MNESFMRVLNQMRVEGSQVINDRLPELTSPSDISKWAEVIFENPNVYNEFCDGLVSKLIATQFEAKTHSNKFDVFEGVEYPVGLTVENAYTNPALGTKYDPNDLAGILAVYKADTKVQYFNFNFDRQYRVTVYYDELRQAMLSLQALSSYITKLTNSLYSGASIEMKRRTIGIMSSAYENNVVNIKTISAVTSKETAEALLVSARTDYLNFQEEGDKYNSFKKCGGTGTPVITWTNPEDIYFIIRNDVYSEITVRELANVFHMEEAKLLGHILGVQSFDVYDELGNIVKSEDDLVAVMCDKAFFDIHKQFQYMTSDRNSSARATQYILNIRKSYNMNCFANCVMYATAQPVVNPTSMSYGVETVTIDEVGDIEGLEITTVPASANATITYESEDDDVFTVEANPNNNKIAMVTATGEGTATLTATCGDVSTTVEITIPTSA